MILRFRFLLLLAAVAGISTTGYAQSPGQPQGPGRAVAPVQTGPTIAFRAINYQIRASLDAIGQVLNAQAKVDFVASDASRIVQVELNRNLRVNAVRDGAGRPVPYDRDEVTAQTMHITLPDEVPAGGKVTLQFDYGGPLSAVPCGLCYFFFRKRR